MARDGTCESLPSFGTAQGLSDPTMNTQSNMTEPSESFRNWVAANGAFIHPHVSFLHDLGSDRGVVASRKIKADTQLVSVPLDMCIHLPTDAQWASHKAGSNLPS